MQGIGLGRRVIGAVLAMLLEVANLTGIYSPCADEVREPNGMYVLFSAGESGYASGEWEARMEETLFLLSDYCVGWGFPQALVTRQEGDLIRVELPSSPEAREAIEVIAASPQLVFLDPEGGVVVNGPDMQGISMAVDRSESGPNSYCVEFKLRDEAAARFAEATERLIGQTISIVLDDEVISAPTVTGRIEGDVRIVLGSGSDEEESYRNARDLCLRLMAGALPLPLTEIEWGDMG